MRAHRKKTAFSLLEVMVSLGIIAVLGTASVPLVSGTIGTARISSTVKEMKILDQGLYLYYWDNGSFPTNAQNLTSLIEEPVPAPPNWRGPYVHASPDRISNDSWGNPYEYIRYPDFGNSCQALRQNCSLIFSRGLDQQQNWQTVPLTARGDDLYIIVSAVRPQRAYQQETMARLTTIMHELAKNTAKDNIMISFGDLDAGRNIAEAGGNFCPKQDPLMSPHPNGQKNIDDISNLTTYHRLDPWENRFVWHQNNNEFYSCGPNQQDDDGGADDIRGSYP